eukprot:SAG31_NODE_173_length_21354_cov_16.826112_22_plen_664_part_00
MMHRTLARCWALMISWALQLAVGQRRPAMPTAQPDRAVCDPLVRNQFCFSHDMYSSDTGYYQVANYDSTGAPDLEVEIGTTYTFDQTDETNWYHPIGFAYYPDGAHGGRTELMDDAGCEAFCATEAGAGCTEGCSECDSGCDSSGAVSYQIDDGWTGTWAEVGLASNTGTNTTIFVPGYEPEFFIPKDQWLRKHYRVQLTITGAVLKRAQGGEIFYFCHIHNRMSGRIIIRDASATSIPTPLYPPHRPEPFDLDCGTYQASQYEEASVCGGVGSVLCGDGASDGSRFSRCLAAINCKMMQEMRVRATQPGVDQTMALFMQQMIPHHANAVNMAKILMKEVDDSQLNAPSVEMEEKMVTMLYSIVNSQNYQIHQMEAYLQDMGSPRGSAACPPTANAPLESPSLSVPTASRFGTLPHGDRLSYKLVHDTFDTRFHAGNFRVVGHDSSIIGHGDAMLSPTLRGPLGHDLVLDQSDHSNWYHPIMFGVDEGLMPLSDPVATDSIEYQIDGRPVTSTEYITQFRYPKEQWNSYHTYRVILHVSENLASEADAGLYYFSALHRGLELPGRISFRAETAVERTLPPIAPFDSACGTVATAAFTPGTSRCRTESSAMMCGDDSDSNLPTVLDSWIKQCFAAADCKMAFEMRRRVQLDERRDVTFIRQVTR